MRERIRKLFEDPQGGPAILRRLLVDYGARETKPYLLALGFGAIAAACTAGTVYLIGTVVNQAYVSRNFQAIMLLALAVIGIFAAKGIAMYWSNVVLAQISKRIIAEIQRRVFDRLLLQGLGFYASRHSSEFLHRVTNGSKAAANTLKLLVNTLGRDLLTLISLATVMVVQEPILSLIALLVMPLAVMFIRNLIRRTRELAKMEQKGAMYIFETLQETLRGLPVVKAFSLEEEMRTRVRGAIEEVERRQLAFARLSNRTSPVMESLGGVSIALVLMYGGYRVIELGAAPGEFVSFITAFLLAYEPAKRVAKLNISLTRNLHAARMLFELMDAPASEPDEPETQVKAIERGEIRFERVQFAYAKRQPVLRDFTFTAEAGKMTALVGASGGGKTTIVGLIMRFYDPQGGAIEIDGVDIRQIPRKQLRSQIAYVGQDIFLFRGTIADNIRYGKLDASADEVVAAAKAAYAHDFISRLPKGYDTPVAESGGNLSTGQRQRIAVARALIRNAPIILLD
jgi:ATP-binding cassette subfamily B protein